MKDGPDISVVAGLIGDPARSYMIMALMSGLSLSATELAREAGVTPSTATGHLKKLHVTGLITGTKRGRHRDFRVAHPDVAEAVQAVIGVGAKVGGWGGGDSAADCGVDGRAGLVRLGDSDPR